MLSLRKISLPVALAAAVASVFALTTPAISAADAKGKKEKKFHAKLDATQEAPAISSLATGEFSATLNAQETQLSFELSWEGLEGGNATAAHVHLGQPGVAGGVMFFLCGGGSKPACPAGTDATITGTIVASDVVGPANQGISPGEFAEVIRNMREKNLTYANVHSVTFGGGEIRGVVQD